MPIGNRAGFEVARSYGAGLVSVVEDLGAMNAGLRQAFEIAAGEIGRTGARLDDLPEQQLAMGEGRCVGASARGAGPRRIPALIAVDGDIDAKLRAEVLLVDRDIGN